MGNWNLTILGVGSHHNSLPAHDIDLAAAEFVAKLRSMGQTVESASLTYGGKEDLGEAVKKDDGFCTVIINGKVVNNFAKHAPYEVVVMQAGFKISEKPSVTYMGTRFGDGRLFPGGTIEVQNKTEFNVVKIWSS